MKKPRVLTISPENSDQIKDGWNYARQRDFTGGETLALLPEMVGRNQLVRMENAIISPEGLVTETWQMDKDLFINVSTGIVVAPIPGSKLFTVYGADGDNVVSFTFDPNSPTPYDMANASGYPGYELRAHANPVTIMGMSHGTPFLGKNYCCGSTNLYIGTELTASPASLDFGTVQTLVNSQINLTITNATANPVTLTGVSFGADGASFGHAGAFPQTVAAAGTYTFPVVFNPPTVGAKASILSLSSNIGILQINVGGISEAQLVFTPASWTFSNTLVGGVDHKTATLANSGTRNIVIAGPPVVTIGPFSGVMTNTIIAAGSTVNVDLYFLPTSLGPVFADLLVLADVGTITVPLTGMGI